MNKKEREMLVESIERANKLKERELNQQARQFDLTLQESQKIKTADQYFLNEIDKLKAENEKLKERDLTLTSYEKVLKEVAKVIEVWDNPSAFSLTMSIDTKDLEPKTSAYLLIVMLNGKDNETFKQYFRILEKQGII